MSLFRMDCTIAHYYKIQSTFLTTSAIQFKFIMTQTVVFPAAAVCGSAGSAQVEIITGQKPTSPASSRC